MSFKEQYYNQTKPLQLMGQGRQQGFVLILSLVMLTMLTLIGVSSMNSATIELKATANAQQHQVAFNAVSSMLEYTRSKPAEGTTAGLIDYQTTAAGTQTVTRISSTALSGTSNLTADIDYLGCAKAKGSSLEEGKGFSYGYYSVAGSAANATGTATSLQTQGVRFPAASC